MSPPTWVALGALLGTGFLFFVRPHGPRRARSPIAVGLVVAAIYLAAALVGRDASGVWLDGLGVVAFGAAAAAGLRWPLALGAGWTGHVAWDPSCISRSRSPTSAPGTPGSASASTPSAGYVAWTARAR